MNTTQYRRTGRTFTIALRTCDAVCTSILGDSVELKWTNIGQNVTLPPDLPPGAQYEVEYSFSCSLEGTPQVGDNFGFAWSSKDVYCNLAKMNASTFEYGIVDLGIGLPYRAQATKTGWIAKMDVVRADACHSDLHPYGISAFDTASFVGGAGYYTASGSTLAPLKNHSRWRTQKTIFFCPRFQNDIYITYRNDVPDPRTIDPTPAVVQADLDVAKVHNGHFKYSNAGVPFTSGATQLPLFFSMTQSPAIQPPLVFDTCAPLGTHVFRFFLLM